MNIGILGLGQLALHLGRQWVAQGHPVVFGAQDAQRASEKAAEIGFLAAGGTLMQAAQFGSIVVLATPFHRMDEVLRRAGPMNQKILIDCTIPLMADLSPVIGLETSGAEYIASLVPGAYVVKAFQTLRTDVMPDAVHYCSDHLNAKEKTATLISHLGLTPIDAGTLQDARHLEQLAAQALLMGQNHTHADDLSYRAMRWIG